MKKKIILIPIVIITILFFVFYDDGIAVFEIPTENLPLNAVVSNPSITCSAYLKTIIIDSKGREIVSNRSEQFSANPTITYELVATTSDNPISSINMELWSNCKSANNVILGSGTASALIYGQKQAGGTDALFTQKTFSTNQVSFVKNSAGFNKIGSVTFSHDELDNKIKYNKDYKVYFKFMVKSGVKPFDVWYSNYPTVKYQFKLESGKLVTKYTADYKTKLVSPTTVKDTDRDGIQDTFDKCITDAETVNGYNDHDGCPDKAPTTTQSTSTSSTTQPTSTPTPTTTESTKKGTVYLKYKMILENDVVQNDITKSGGIGIEFKPLSLVEAKGKRFMSIFVEPILKLEGSSSDYSATVSGLKYGAQIQYTDQVWEVKNFVGSTNSRIIKDSSGYYHFPPFEITSDMIEKTMEQVQDINKNSPNAIKLRLAVNGDFDLTRQSDNKKFKAVVVDVGMYMDMSYDPSKVIDYSEPCQGLNGEAQLECKKKLCADTGECLPPSSTGGYCEDVQTSIECIDKKNNCNDIFGLASCGTITEPIGKTGGGSKVDTKNDPKINKGNLQICDDGQTLTECVEKAKENIIDKTESFGIDQTTLVIIIIIFLIIIVVIMVARRKKP